ncbi:MAG: MATE family efflux transporter [Rhizobiales bacterium]|nr:MATE family efflux transporter [Hyphomicrobiales bacterium]NRB14972.1 MATE family efflux transporter [Hyphomicrobiales bacterium]
MKNQTSAKFVTGSLLKHVVVMSLTSSVGIMAIFIVDLVDLLFISMLGNAALAAAVGYAGIVLFFTNSINMGLSIAAGTLVAKALGAEQKSEAREYASSVMAIGFLICIIIVVATFYFLDPILTTLGATGEVKALSIDYISIILPTMPITSIAFIGMAVLRSHGDAKRSMYATLAGGVVNAIFDPLLIFTLDFGLEGAAMASVLSRLTMIGITLFLLIKTHNAVALPSLKSISNHLKPITTILIPAVLANVATPVGSAIVMREMAKYGTDAVAGMAIIGRMTPVAFSVVFALSGAIGPIVGQNFGAGKMERVRTAFFDAIKFTIGYIILVSLILFFIRDYIITLFGATGEAAALVMLFCGVLSMAFFFNGVIYITNACFNNLGHPIYSTYVNWGKNTLGTLPFIIIGGSFWGAEGVLLGQAFGGLLFAGVAVWLCLRVMSAGGVESEISDFEQHQRLHIVQNRRH